MKRLLIFVPCLAVLLFLIRNYENSVSDNEPIPAYQKVDNKINRITVANDSLCIWFNSNYFHSIFISSEVTATTEERFIFNNTVAVKDFVAKIPLKEMIGYEGEKYNAQNLQLIKLELRAKDSIFKPSDDSYVDEFYKTSYNHYELWHRDNLNQYQMGKMWGNTFFIQK